MFGNTLFDWSSLWVWACQSSLLWQAILRNLDACFFHQIMGTYSLCFDQIKLPCGKVTLELSDYLKKEKCWIFTPDCLHFTLKIKIQLGTWSWLGDKRELETEVDTDSCIFVHLIEISYIGMPETKNILFSTKSINSWYIKVKSDSHSCKRTYFDWFSIQHYKVLFLNT